MGPPKKGSLSRPHTPKMNTLEWTDADGMDRAILKRWSAHSSRAKHATLFGLSDPMQMADRQRGRQAAVGRSVDARNAAAGDVLGEVQLWVRAR